MHSYMSKDNLETRSDAVVPISGEKVDALHLEYSSKADQDAVDYSGAHAKTDPAEIKLVKKLDWFIMPMLWMMYAFNYLDRNAIALARLDNLEKELKLEGSQYQTCISILFVGYCKSTHV